MSNVKPSEIIILASGALLLLFSFFDWYGAGRFGANAWDDFFPLLTWPALFGTAAAVLLAVQKFGNVTLPDRVVGFTWPQLYIVAGVVSVLITLGFLIANESDNKAGLFLSLLGAIGLVVGGYMYQSEASSSSGAPPSS